VSRLRLDTNAVSEIGVRVFATNRECVPRPAVWFPRHDEPCGALVYEQERSSEADCSADWRIEW
jgi:hypothetical protein